MVRHIILSDDGFVFRGKKFFEFLKDWNVEQCLSCTYRSQVNGVVKRIHWTIKISASRSGRPLGLQLFVKIRYDWVSRDEDGLISEEGSTDEIGENKSGADESEESSLRESRGQEQKLQVRPVLEGVLEKKMYQNGFIMILI